MTHSSLQNRTPLDPEKAIWQKDLAELKRSLDSGWSLPYVSVKGEGMVEDFSLAIRVVSLRWVEGWKALAEAFPELRERRVLRSLAIRQAVSGIVQDLIEHGMDPAAPVGGDEGRLPLHLLQEAMGPRAGEPVYEDDILATARVLVGAGADPTLSYPGAFVPGDIAPGGHCFWTRAMFFRHWKIARHFLPGSWEELTAQPRGKEMLEGVRKMSERNDMMGARQMWVDLLERWMGPWLESTPEEWFAFPGDLEVLPKLSKPARALVWQRWDRINHLGWTGLHEVALSAGDPIATQVLALAHQDEASCLRHWKHPDELGMRPCDLWEIANSRRPSREGVSIQDILPNPAS